MHIHAAINDCARDLISVVYCISIACRDETSPATYRSLIRERVIRDPYYFIVMHRLITMESYDMVILLFHKTSI